jgi:hypothetical protein
MRTQSVDTHPDTERIMIEVVRRAPMSKRFKLVQSLTQSAFWSNICAWRESHREASEQEAAVHFLSCSYGIALAQRVQAALEQREDWHMQPIDLMAVMLPARHAFDELRVPYYLGGSIASSLHGMQRLAQDIDLVVDLGEATLPSLLALLQQHYLLDEDEIRKAVRARMSFPLIHLDSLMKVDVVLSKQDAFDTFMRQLVTPHRVDDHYPPFRLASASEMILFKLRRYQRDERSRTDGMQDDAEWNDILGMLKVQGPDLDMALLAEWVGKPDVMETWQRALVDAGLQGA